MVNILHHLPFWHTLRLLQRALTVKRCRYPLFKCGISVRTIVYDSYNEYAVQYCYYLRQCRFSVNVVFAVKIKSFNTVFTTVKIQYELFLHTSPIRST